MKKHISLIIKDWYDKNVKSLNDELKQIKKTDPDGCRTARKLEDKYRKSFEKFQQGEADHTNPGWEGFVPGVSLW
jgi:hypothetical protein